MTARHPMQPLVKDKAGTIRFKENAIVVHLLDHGGFDMNKLAVLKFSREDREQFAQLIGYSVDGSSELSYVHLSTSALAYAIAKKLGQDDPIKDADERRAFADAEGAFAEWQATRRHVESIGDELSGGDEGAGFVYSCGFIMETVNQTDQPLPRYHLIIERSEWLDDDLAKLERILWDEWVKDEIAD